MFILFILGLVLGGLVVIFSLQNTESISVAFLGWQIESSLASILLLTLCAGLMVALLFTLPKNISNYFKYKKLLSENKNLKKEIEAQKEKVVFAKVSNPTKEDLEKIEKGAIDDSL